MTGNTYDEKAKKILSEQKDYNPYYDKIKKLEDAQEEYREELVSLKKLYGMKLVDNAKYLGLKFAKRLKPSLLLFSYSELTEETNWFDFYVTDKKEIKKRLGKIVDRINEVADSIVNLDKQIKELSYKAEQFNYFKNFPVNDVNAIIGVVDKLFESYRN